MVECTKNHSGLSDEERREKREGEDSLYWRLPTVDKPNQQQRVVEPRIEPIVVLLASGSAMC